MHGSACLFLPALPLCGDYVDPADSLTATRLLQKNLNWALDLQENGVPVVIGGQGIGEKGVTNKYEHKGVWYLNVISESKHHIFNTEENREVR